MAKSTSVIAIEVTADTSSAIGDLDKAKGAVKSYGDAADTATKQSRDVSGGIESVGSVAGGATTGLRDMADAVAMAGFPQLSAGMAVAATGLESLDGAATLYASAQEGAAKAGAMFTKVMNVMKVSILTNPVFIIAAVLILIGVAFVIAYKKCETFRNIVNGAFRLILSTIKTVWGWIKNNWPLLLAVLTGPIGLAVLVITKNWGKISTAANTAYTFIKGIWGKLTAILTGPFESAWDTISGIFTKIRDAVSSVTSLIKKIPKPSIPDLNPFNASATATGYAAPATRGVARAPAARAVAPSGPTVVVNGALDPDAVARQIKLILGGHARRTGHLAGI